MWKPKAVSWVRSSFVVCMLAASYPSHAQSPYGLSARQTIPFVVDVQPSVDRPVAIGSTEVNVHNPGAFCIKVQPTYMGAVGTSTPGQSVCTPQIIRPQTTVEFSLRAACPQLNPGYNYGRLELFATGVGQDGDDVCPSPASNEPSDFVFLANARVGWLSRFFTVEAFPLGQLSANKGFAIVTGLKHGFVDGAQWASHCYVAPLNEPMTAFVRLRQGYGAPLGGVSWVALTPPAIEMRPYAPDVFTAVNAPPGNHRDVTAFFATSILNGGGLGGGGILPFCLIDNQTTGQTAFQIAKYLDNNDESREALTVVSHHRFGKRFSVIAEVDDDFMERESNLHVAYFQHPDRIHCRVDFESSPSLATFDLVQMRLLDPDNVEVAGGPHITEFTLDLGDKSQRFSGRNGRWMIEVAPDRAILSSAGLHQGGLEVAKYTLTCSSGNGHNQLESIGHCLMHCRKSGNKEALCDFAPFPQQLCF